mmetsp:Transcript_31174/g.56949  ORF Transcript_31174/g.56949 Transcript_31174/m.56949 type:complete len:384 (-) Transcript_31174:221-1372(-)
MATKRKTPSEAQKRSKKPRNNQISCVVEALESSSLPRSCCEMLGIIADTSLAMPSDERSLIDNKAVGLVEAALKAIHTQYATEADEVRKAKEVAQAAFADVEAACTSLRATEEAAKSDTSALKHGLAAAYEGFATKRDALDRVRLEMSKKTDAVNELEEDHSLVEAGRTAFTALKDESFEAVPAPKCTVDLEAAIAKCAIEESLRLALPSTLSKPVAQRAAFHTQVFNMLDAALAEKLQQVESKLQVATQAAEELKEQEKAATEERQAAMNALKEEAFKFKASEELWHKERNALDEASAKTAAALEVLSSKEASDTDATSKLQDFENINLECFALLKCKVSKASTQEASAEKQAPTDVAADGQSKTTLEEQGNMADTVAAAGA